VDFGRVDGSWHQPSGIIAHHAPIQSKASRHCEIPSHATLADKHCQPEASHPKEILVLKKRLSVDEVDCLMRLVEAYVDVRLTEKPQGPTSQLFTPIGPPTRNDVGLILWLSPHSPPANAIEGASRRLCIEKQTNIVLLGKLLMLEAASICIQLGR
jgi:hypothetical protein